MSRRLLTIFSLLLAFCALAGTPAAHAAIPASWPFDRLALGTRDEEGGAQALRQATRLDVRYHYLSGGVSGGSGWVNWTKGGGSFVPGFIDDSAANGFLPVFSYYQLRESAPGKDMDEATGDLSNLENRDTMAAYFKDARLFFQEAGSTGKVAVLHIEPDLWGYVERAAAAADGTASSVPAQVSTTGLSELDGLPNTAAGVAQAFVRLRDRYAPKVLLGYHLSVWGTGEDISRSDPSDAHVDELSAAATAYYRSLGARFDLIFAEQTDRDSGYARVVDGDDGSAVWSPDDFARQARFLRGVSSATGKSVVLWQLPLGNAAQNDTPGHYKDNRVQTLLGAEGADVRRAYLNAGVIGLLFGKALPNTTCACDNDGDGRDDDGGLFKRLANTLVDTGGLGRLPDVAAKPAATAPTRTTAPIVTVRASVGKSRVPRGGTAAVSVRLTARSTAQVVVAVQLYRPGAGTTPTFQMAFRGQKLRAGVPKRYRATFKLPAGAKAGHWKVKVGLFDPSFQTLLVWRPDAAAFAVR